MLDKKEVTVLAQLARLELSEKELEKYNSDLGKILEFVEILNKADIEKIKPTHQLSKKNLTLRVDEVTRDKNFKPKLLKDAPMTEDDSIKVRAVLEEYRSEK